jgi:beta-lactamase superfamily II metal-dependent hydrolase
MKYEIEMLNIGCADSVILRYLTDSDQEWVVVIDAGNKGDGKKVMQKINNYTNQKYIDLAICTHPDNDHIGGFFDIVGNMKISKFWIHEPAKHVDLKEIRKSITLTTLKRSLTLVTQSLDNSSDLLSLIERNGIVKEEPFSGLRHSKIPLFVVGPSIVYYDELLKSFRDIENLYKQEAYMEESRKSEADLETLSETLDEEDDKSSENASSAIVLSILDNKKYLFTGDANCEAQEKAGNEYDLSNLHWLKVPHHGSKYNLNSNLIKTYNPSISYIPCDGSKKYPSRAVVNSLKKVGSKVYCTNRNNGLHHPGNLGQRPEYHYPAIEE